MTNIKGKKILVTGGAGFIGSHLVDALIAQGAHVSIIDNLSTGRKENLNPKAVFYHLDMRDKEVENVFKKEKPEIIYHLAFNTDMHKSVEDPIFDAQGILGSLNVFNLAHAHKVKKVIMASSAMVYGNHPEHTLPVTEAHALQPATPYAISKIATENYLRFFNIVHKLPIAILRYPTIYGPRQTGGALADYIRKLSSGQPGDMFGDGNLTRDYVCVDDIVRANLLALEIKAHEGEPIFNLGSAQEITLNELHQRIAGILKKPKLRPVYHKFRTGEVFRFCVSNQKAKVVLGWQPMVSLDTGLSKTVAHFVKTQSTR